VAFRLRDRRSKCFIFSVPPSAAKYTLKSVFVPCGLAVTHSRRQIPRGVVEFGSARAFESGFAADTLDNGKAGSSVGADGCAGDVVTIGVGADGCAGDVVIVGETNTDEEGSIEVGMAEDARVVVAGGGTKDSVVGIVDGTEVVFAGTGTEVAGVGGDDGMTTGTGKGVGGRESNVESEPLYMPLKVSGRVNFALRRGSTILICSDSLHFSFVKLSLDIDIELVSDSSERSPSGFCFLASGASEDINALDSSIFRFKLSAFSKAARHPA
jgi:hypothetical protein